MDLHGARESGCFCFFQDEVSLYRSGCPGTCPVDQTDLELWRSSCLCLPGAGIKACATKPQPILHCLKACTGCWGRGGVCVGQIKKEQEGSSQCGMCIIARVGVIQLSMVSSANIAMTLELQSCVHVCTHTCTTYPLTTLINIPMLACTSMFYTHSGKHANLIHVCAHCISNNYFCAHIKHLYGYSILCVHTHVYEILCMYTHIQSSIHTQGHTPLYSSCYTEGGTAYQGLDLEREVSKFRRGVGSGKPPSCLVEEAGRFQRACFTEQASSPGRAFKPLLSRLGEGQSCSATPPLSQLCRPPPSIAVISSLHSWLLGQLKR